MLQAHFLTFKPRNPLLRVLAGVLAILAIGAFLALGVFALGVLVIGGVLFMLVNALRGKTTATTAGAARKPVEPAPGIIEGEFSVVSENSSERNSHAS